jgi:hypothetical protein
MGRDIAICKFADKAHLAVFLTINKRDFVWQEESPQSFSFFVTVKPPVGLGLLCKVPCSHYDTPHSVGLLWTNDWPVADFYLTKHSTDK